MVPHVIVIKPGVPLLVGLVDFSSQGHYEVVIRVRRCFCRLDDRAGACFSMMYIQMLPRTKEYCVSTFIVKIDIKPTLPQHQRPQDRGTAGFILMWKAAIRILNGLRLW